VYQDMSRTNQIKHVVIFKI